MRSNCAQVWAQIERAMSATRAHVGAVSVRSFCAHTALILRSHCTHTALICAHKTLWWTNSILLALKHVSITCMDHVCITCIWILPMRIQLATTYVLCHVIRRQRQVILTWYTWRTRDSKLSKYCLPVTTFCERIWAQCERNMSAVWAPCERSVSAVSAVC